MLKNQKVLDRVGLLDVLVMLNDRNVLDGNNVLSVTCLNDPILPNKLADPLGIKLLELQGPQPYSLYHLQDWPEIHSTNGRSLVIYKEVTWYDTICRDDNKTSTYQEYKNIGFSLQVN